MKQEYTLTELLQIAEQTKNIELLKMIREEINKKIESLCVEYGMQVAKPEKKKKIGFSKD